MTSLRTLIIAECFPYPPVVGKDLRNWQNVCGLSKISQVGLFGLRANDPYRHNIPPQELAFWSSTKDPALVYPPRIRSVPARAWIFEPTGHPADLHFTEIAAKEAAEAMMRFKPQVVVLEGMWACRYIDTLRRFDCRIVLDCHNVEAAVYQEIADSVQGNELPARLIRKFLPSRTRMLEQKATRAVDQLWVCSDNDAKLMIELYGESTPIEVIPNSIDVSRYDATRARRYRQPERVPANGKVVIYPALFGWHPNIVAASFLINEFFPRLSKLFPDSQLVLAGSRPTPEMIEAGKKNPRIVITDTVDDMRPYFAASSVMVVPLFQGGGTRFKILEAFASHLPVVSTSKGAEGLSVENGKHLLIAENIDDFIAGVRRIWAEPGLADHLRKNGTELVNKLYSLTSVSERIRVAIDHLELANGRQVSGSVT